MKIAQHGGGWGYERKKLNIIKLSTLKSQFGTNFTPIMASKQLIWAMKVKAIVDAHYVPESERDCCKAIWQRWVLPVYPICLNTFYIWMRLAVAHDGYLGNGQNRVYKNKFAPQLRLQGERNDIIPRLPLIFPEDDPAT